MALIPGVNGIGNSLGLLLLSFCRYLVIFTRRKACCLPDLLLEGKLGILDHFLPSPLSSTSDANVKDTPVSLQSTTTNLDTFSSQVHFLGAVCWPFLPWLVFRWLSTMTLLGMILLLSPPMKCPKHLTRGEDEIVFVAQGSGWFRSFSGQGHSIPLKVLATVFFSWGNFSGYFVFCFLFFNFPMPCALRNLSSLTREQTHVLGRESSES